MLSRDDVAAFSLSSTFAAAALVAGTLPEPDRTSVTTEQGTVETPTGLAHAPGIPRGENED
jgi:hypothetical protein